MRLYQLADDLALKTKYIILQVTADEYGHFKIIPYGPFDTEEAATLAVNANASSGFQGFVSECYQLD